MYGLITQFEAVSAKRDELAELLASVGSMPGCTGYIVAKDADDPDSLWVTEFWESKQAHAASLSLPATRETIEKGRPLIAGFTTRVETEPIGGIGI